ncbi:MAG: pyridoxal-phosphate dependent enzyme [Thaumarchaeota archaeon]|nr:pyridoxal-phosphate dependent enzyme [Nitrososphaerota archaeon]
MDAPWVSLAKIEEARERISGIVVRTPLVPASRFEDDGVYLKMECLQPTGSFKVRGAWNRVSTSTDEERRRGFVTVSAGNHGQALAWAAKRVGSSCTVYVPEDAVERKVESIKSMGATTIRRPHQEIMESMSDDRMTKLGMTFVHPFADPKVVAGQGTIGLEILEDKPRVRTVVVPVGGGGLVNGIAQAIKAKRPEVEFYGVQAEGAAPLPMSLRSGVAEDFGDTKTIADGIGATRVYDYMLPLFKKNLKGAFTVSDEELKLTMGRLANESHVVVEPAGAAALAGALKHRKELEEPIVCVVSGGNVDPKLLREVLEAGERKGTL